MDAAPARYWEARGARVVCTACPRRCTLSDGQEGYCLVRANEGGRLVLRTYARPEAVAVDPIEKKPLYHFLPGTTILSLGTAGCCLGCRFCQNWDLSRARPGRRAGPTLLPEEVPDLCGRTGAASVAFTYNEPAVFAEYAVDVARACRERGIPSVAVTAGYMDGAARDDLYGCIAAANVDLKSFDDGFYRKQCAARLAPVLETIEHAAARGVWVELTTLLVPGLNDAEDLLVAECRWIVERLGRDVPLHLSAFHPDYKLLDVAPTPPATLRRARALALGEGLRHVYTGNVRDDEGSATRCPSCGRVLVERAGFAVLRNELVGTGACRCGARIAGVFDERSRPRSDGLRRTLA